MSRRIHRGFAALGAGAILALLCATAPADQIFMSVEATQQGLLKGSISMKGWEGKIAATKYTLQISAPPTGKRQYGPVRVTKPLDAATPQLLQALVNNEAIKKVTIDFVSQAAPGQAQASLARSVVLQGVRVIDIQQSTEADPAGGVRAVEEVTFAFSHIEVSDVAGRTAMVDDLSRP